MRPSLSKLCEVTVVIIVAIVNILKACCSPAHQIKPDLLDRLEQTYTPRSIPSSSHRNRCYFILEHLEASWMKQFVSHLLRDFSPVSLIWIHDGLWISTAPSQTQVDTANRLATSSLHLSPSPFFFARCCLGKVPGGSPFSQLHKGIGSITRTGQLMQLYKPKQIQTKKRQQQIPNCGGREDETDARAVRPNSLARCIE